MRGMEPKKPESDERYLASRSTPNTVAESPIRLTYFHIGAKAK